MPWCLSQAARPWLVRISPVGSIHPCRVNSSMPAPSTSFACHPRRLHRLHPRRLHRLLPPRRLLPRRLHRLLPRPLHRLLPSPLHRLLPPRLHRLYLRRLHRLYPRCCITPTSPRRRPPAPAARAPAATRLLPTRLHPWFPFCNGAWSSRSRRLRSSSGATASQTGLTINSGNHRCIHQALAPCG